MHCWICTSITSSNYFHAILDLYIHHILKLLPCKTGSVHPSHPQVTSMQYWIILYIDHILKSTPMQHWSVAYRECCTGPVNRSSPDDTTMQCRSTVEQSDVESTCVQCWVCNSVTSWRHSNARLERCTLIAFGNKVIFLLLCEA